MPDQLGREIIGERFVSGAQRPAVACSVIRAKLYWEVRCPLYPHFRMLMIEQWPFCPVGTVWASQVVVVPQVVEGPTLVCQVRHMNPLELIMGWNNDQGQHALHLVGPGLEKKANRYLPINMALSVADDTLHEWLLSHAAH